MPTSNPIAQIDAFYERTNLVNIVLETPRGAPYKLKYDATTRIFRVHKALPFGFIFPFNFGFVPRTRGGDGDPLDVLVVGRSLLFESG